MKRMLVFIIVLMALTACSTPQTQAPTENPAPNIPAASLPNPASVYCQENGNKLEIQTASDGSQTGVCIFPDGSTCEEWAYFRGECTPATHNSALPSVSTEAAQKASDEGAGVNASGGYMAPGTAEEFNDWWGVIKSTELGAQYDDFFERQDLGQVFIYFGIDSLDAAVQSQIEELRDSGKVVHLYGTLLSNVPDYNGSQVQVDQIEILE